MGEGCYSRHDRVMIAIRFYSGHNGARGFIVSRTAWQKARLACLHCLRRGLWVSVNSTWLGGEISSRPCLSPRQILPRGRK